MRHGSAGLKVVKRDTFVLSSTDIIIGAFGALELPKSLKRQDSASILAPQHLNLTHTGTPFPNPWVDMGKVGAGVA